METLRDVLNFLNEFDLTDEKTYKENKEEEEDDVHEKLRCVKKKRLVSKFEDLN